MHAATALPTFTLSGSPISHSMKYALKIYKQFTQVARECSKESFTIPKSLISSSTSPIHLFQKFNGCQQFGNCAMILRKETYLGPHSLNFSCLKPENSLNPHAASYYLRERTLPNCQLTSFTQIFGFLRSHSTAP